MTLVPFDLFAAINTALFTGVDGFYALRIKDAIAWLGGTTYLFTAIGDQSIQTFLPNAALVPFAEMIINRLPRRKIVGHHSPLHSAFDNIQNRVDYRSDGVFAPASSTTSRQKIWFN